MVKGPLLLRGLGAGREQAGWAAAQLDLAADLVADGDAVALALEYNADMFHSETAGRIAGHFLVRRSLCLQPCAHERHRPYSRPLSRLSLELRPSWEA